LVTTRRVGTLVLEKGTGFHIQTRVGVYELPPWLRPTYFLDESDPDILVLRRAENSFVAAFSAQGATRESIRQAAEEDYQERNPLTTELPSPLRDGEGEDGGMDKAWWEEFLQAERRVLEERKGGQLARRWAGHCKVNLQKNWTCLLARTKEEPRRDSWKFCGRARGFSST
jgi:hypothetical protein